MMVNSFVSESNFHILSFSNLFYTLSTHRDTHIHMPLNGYCFVSVFRGAFFAVTVHGESGSS